MINFSGHHSLSIAFLDMFIHYSFIYMNWVWDDSSLNLSSLKYVSKSVQIFKHILNESGKSQVLQ